MPVNAIDSQNLGLSPRASIPSAGSEKSPIPNQAIVATGLTKWFGEGGTRKVAVNNVGLVAHFGEMLFNVGRSGSAKTTMLNMISGILRPNAGNFTVIRKVLKVEPLDIFRC